MQEWMEAIRWELIHIHIHTCIQGGDEEADEEVLQGVDYDGLRLSLTMPAKFPITPSPPPPISAA